MAKRNKLKLVIDSGAVEDIQKAYLYYEKQLPNLGEKLLLALDNAFDLILIYPMAFPNKYKHYHQFVLSGFPFVIVYSVTKSQVLINAVFHTSRDRGELD